VIVLHILHIQANTDECVGLGPGEAYCYSWRTHKIKQVINLVLTLWFGYIDYYYAAHLSLTGLYIENEKV